MKPIDLFRAQIGCSYDNAQRDWQVSARRLVDILFDGLGAKHDRWGRGHCLELG
jgi:hypothetical protein